MSLTDKQPLSLQVDYQPLGRVVFGAGTICQLGSLIRAYGGSRVMLVTDPGLAKAGHPERVAKYVTEERIPVFIFDGVRENPTEREVDAGVRFARDHEIDFLLAVGGGSSMDCAKGVNFILTNGGRMADYRGHGKATQPMLPSIGVPPTSGTGSEAQSYALITDESSHMKMACGDKKAAFRVSILDPELTLSQPNQVTAVTGIDAIAHAIESYVCTKANPISRMASLAAWRHLQANFERVLQKPSDLVARAEMQIGSHLAGMAIESAMLGICHSCANPLTAHYGITHGIAIGLMLPHVIRFNGMNVEEDFGELCQTAKLSGLGSSTDLLAGRVRELVKAAKLPASLKECGVSQSILPLLAHEANQQWTARFNPRPVTDADLLEVYQSAW